jgi:ABC-2 type transport system ATP-binding protein
MSSKSENVIEIKGLVKKFGAFNALDGLDLTVTRGEVHGFLGPNGSGKSTTIRVLLGELRKSGGEVRLFGQDPWDDAVKLHERLSYVPGDVNLWPNLTGGEVIDLFCNLRGSVDKQRKKKLLDDFQLDPRKKCRTYSKGNRQKVALVAALATDSELYILDEPTSGLDPLMESVFQKHVKQLKAEGKTILLSSHILAEVEALADTVTIIRSGKTVEQGDLDHLRHLGQQTVKATLAKKPTGFDKLKGVHDLVVKGDSVQFAVDTKDLDGVIRHLSGFGIERLVCEPQSLEDLFIKHYDTSNEEA